MTTWTPHTQDSQPKNTKGKRVVYRCHGSHIVHLPHPADEINWTTLGDKRPQIGMISEYAIVG